MILLVSFNILLPRLFIYLRVNTCSMLAIKTISNVYIYVVPVFWLLLWTIISPQVTRLLSLIMVLDELIRSSIFKKSFLKRSMWTVKKFMECVLNRWMVLLNQHFWNTMQLTHFMPLISFYIPWKHQKISGFLMFSGDIERH